MSHGGSKKTENVHFRCSEEDKEEFTRMAELFGYPNLSTFVLAVLTSMQDRYADPPWRSGLLHMAGPVVVKADLEPSSDRSLVSGQSFDVVAPESFWVYLEELAKEA